MRSATVRTAGDGLNGLAVCAGFGGLELGFRLVFGECYRTVCVVEREAFAAAGLVALMEAGYLDSAPVWDDVVTFDGRPWRGVVDLISAGLPCQPYSLAGRRRGDADERAIWPEFVRVVREVRPALVFIENVPPFLAWYRPIGDRLSRLGYDYQAGLFRASEVGAPHRRERLFILAYTGDDGFERDRKRHLKEVRDSTPCRHDVDGRHPSLADAGRTRRPEVPGGAPGDEGQDAWWTTPHDYEPGSRGEAVAHAGDGRLSIAERPKAGRSGPRSPSASLGDADGVLRQYESAGRANTAGRPGDAVVDAPRDGWGERRAASAMELRGQTAAVAGVEVGDAHSPRLEERPRGAEFLAQPTAWPPSPTDHDAWRSVLDVRPDLAPATERGVLRMVDRMAPRVDRLRAIGNGVVPLVAAHAFCALAAQAGLPLERVAPWMTKQSVR